jgi:hypothetical protein
MINRENKIHPRAPREINKIPFILNELLQMTMYLDASTIHINVPCG